MSKNVKGNLVVQCTEGTTNVSIQADTGENASASSSCVAPKRRMKSADNNYLEYTLQYENQNRDVVSWGCAANNEILIPSFVSSGTPVVTDFYAASEWATQNIFIGSYTDTINVTVSF